MTNKQLDVQEQAVREYIKEHKLTHLQVARMAAREQARMVKRMAELAELQVRTQAWLLAVTIDRSDDARWQRRMGKQCGVISAQPGTSIYLDVETGEFSVEPVHQEVK